MTLKVFTDGGAKGNPGPAAIGIIAYIDGRELFRHREDIGVATNNIAEYTAVVTALSKLLPRRQTGKNQISNINVSKVEFYSDSQLLVNQLNGLYKVKNIRIREFILQIRILEQELNIPVFYRHIPREENRVADELVNSK
jgi:ribonuclease HI